MSTSPLTCVSGFWPVKNKHGNKFLEWFKTTLSVNCPYVFFCKKEHIEMIKHFRKGLPTYFIECAIEDFYTYKYKDKMIVHPLHCPSTELNLIWNEKIFLLDKAQQLNPFNSEFFAWVDAGICTYRTSPPPPQPFPNSNKLKHLPKDKIIYSASTPWNPANVTTSTYYHHVAGTAYILHQSIIPNVAQMYGTLMDKIFAEDSSIHKANIWTDQVILTHMFKAFPHKFYKLCDGYGAILPILY